MSDVYEAFHNLACDRALVGQNVSAFNIFLDVLALDNVGVVFGAAAFAQDVVDLFHITV